MHRSLVRSRRGSAATRPGASSDEPLVADDWQRWVVDNLLRGVEPLDLVEGLVEGGVPRALARRTVIEIVRSPGVAAAREHDRRAQRLAQVSRLLTAVGQPGSLERRPAPEADELYGRYWAGSTPAVFTDIVSRWRARWSPQSLRERFGTVRIEACVGREVDPRPDINWRAHRLELSLAEYVDRMHDAGEGNDLYLIANNRNTARGELRALWDDVVLPAGWFNEARLPYGSALWLGPAGTITPLHHDTSNILFCQIHGRKRVVLAPPWVEALLQTAEGVYNRMDIRQVLDDDDIPSLDVVLQPGESLFIPAGWWHDVRALDDSVSLAINAFARSNAFGWYTPGGLR